MRRDVDSTRCFVSTGKERGGVAWDVTTVGGSHRLKEGKKGGGSAGASGGDGKGRESGYPSQALHFLFSFFIWS